MINKCNGLLNTINKYIAFLSHFQIVHENEQLSIISVNRSKMCQNNICFPKFHKSLYNLCTHLTHRSFQRSFSSIQPIQSVGHDDEQFLFFLQNRRTTHAYGIYMKLYRKCQQVAASMMNIDFLSRELRIAVAYATYTLKSLVHNSKTLCIVNVWICRVCLRVRLQAYVFLDCTISSSRMKPFIFLRISVFPHVNSILLKYLRLQRHR